MTLSFWKAYSTAESVDPTESLTCFLLLMHLKPC